MDSIYEEVQSIVQFEINELTAKTLQKLTILWDQTYGREICQENLRKLTEHAMRFYHEVVEETSHRKQTIEEEIKSLTKEAEDLQRLLSVEITLPNLEGLPLHSVKMNMNEQLCDLRDHLCRRKEEIQDLLTEQDNLCQIVGEPKKNLSEDPLATEHDLDEFKSYLKELKKIKIERLLEVEEVRKNIACYAGILNMESLPIINSPLLEDSHLPLTRINVLKLREIKASFESEVKKLKEAILEIKRKLPFLWDCLEVPQLVRDEFCRYNDYSQTTHDVLRGELERRQTQKRENIERFVIQIRKDLVYWWDKVLKSEVERNRFAVFHSVCFTEDLLTLHEMEVESLKEFYEENKKIFELIAERQSLWDQMLALEAKASEPGRYNNRGGQLLKEERERKAIGVKLPNIEAALVKLVQEYNAESNREFTMNGESVEFVVNRDWEKRKDDKQKLMSARKMGVATPNQSRMLRTPLSIRGQNSTTKLFGSTATMSALSSNKRKLPALHQGNAKKSLLSALSSPSVFLSNAKQRLMKITPKSTKIPHVIASEHKRKSGSRLSAGKKQRTQRQHNPKRILNSDSSITSDSVNYEAFQTLCGSAKVTRSTLLESNKNKLPKIVVSSVPISTPTQMKLKNVSQRQRTPSPGAGGKLSTKNLPIII